MSLPSAIAPNSVLGIWASGPHVVTQRESGRTGWRWHIYPHQHESKQFVSAKHHHKKRGVGKQVSPLAVVSRSTPDKQWKLTRSFWTACLLDSTLRLKRESEYTDQWCQKQCENRSIPSMKSRIKLSEKREKAHRQGTKTRIRCGNCSCTLFSPEKRITMVKALLLLVDKKRKGPFQKFYLCRNFLENDFRVVSRSAVYTFAFRRHKLIGDADLKSCKYWFVITGADVLDRTWKHSSVVTFSKQPWTLDKSANACWFFLFCAKQVLAVLFYRKTCSQRRFLETISTGLCHTRTAHLFWPAHDTEYTWNLGHCGKKSTFAVKYESIFESLTPVFLCFCHSYLVSLPFAYLYVGGKFISSSSAIYVCAGFFFFFW